MTRWPDIRGILADTLTPFAPTAGRLTVGWEADVAAGGALLHLTKVGGEIGHVDRTDRIKIDAFALGEPAALELAEAVTEFLRDRYHAVEGREGFIDNVTVESSPTPIPYPSDQVVLVSTVVAATARPIS